MVADCSCFHEAKAHCCYLVRGLASGPSKLETWTLLAAVNARPPYMAAFPKSMWLWIKDPFCRRPLTVTRAVATYLCRKCLVRGMPHKKKSLWQKCFSQARKFCYEPMSRNGPPSLLHTQCFRFTAMCFSGKKPCQAGSLLLLASCQGFG